jgi:hypothetical protein
MDLEILKQELLTRWKHAFNELSLLPEYKAKILTEKYVPAVRYDLKDYGTSAFLIPEGKLFPEARSREINDYHFYGLQEDSFPCYTSFRHVMNNTSCEGYYSYSDELVEYVEFYQTGHTFIPSCIKRIHFKDGQRSAWQSLFINTRGSDHEYEGSPDEIMAAILEDQHSLVIRIEAYNWSDGRITTANGLAIAPGCGEYNYIQQYNYIGDGVLDEIRTYCESGADKLTWVRQEEGLNFQQLEEELVEKLAEAIVDTLAGAKAETPLSLLEINYHSIAEYIPSLSPRSQRFTADISRRHQDEDIFDLIFLATEMDHPYLPIEDEKFERPFRQFIQIIEREEKWELASGMLRKVAWLLTTNKLFNRLPVSDDFAAYAIDWESDMEEFERVLRECGVVPAVISAWQERGWL